MIHTLTNRYPLFQMIPTFSNWSLHTKTTLNLCLCVNAVIRSLCWGFSGWKFCLYLRYIHAHMALRETSTSTGESELQWQPLKSHQLTNALSFVHILTHAYFSKKEKDLEHTVAAEANKGLAHCRRASYSRWQYKHQPGSGVTHVGGQGTESTLWEVRANK